MHRSLKQILAAVTFIGLVPMALLLAFLVYRGQLSAKEEATTALRALASSLASQYALVISNVESQFQELSAVDQIRKGDRKACEAWLAKNLTQTPGGAKWFRATPDGTITCASQGVEPNARLDVSFDLNSPSSYNMFKLSPARIGSKTQRTVIGMSKAYWNDGEPFQIVVSLDAEWFYDTAKKLSTLEDRRIFLLADDGQILLQLPDYTAPNPGRAPTFKKLVLPDDRPRLHTIATGVDGKTRIGASITMHRFANGSRLFFSVSASPFGLYAKARAFIFLGVVAIVLAILGVVVAQQLMFARYFAKPVTAILDYAKNAAQDGVSGPLSLAPSAPQEMNEISNAIASMAQQSDQRAAALSEAMHNLERAEAIANMGHWRLDLKTSTLYWSDGVYKLHGLSREAFTPSLDTAIDHYHPEDREDVRRIISNATQDHKPYDFENRILRADGSYLYVRARGRVTLGRNGEPVSLFGIVIDIDAPKQAQRELKRAQAAAQQLADARASFIASVSHEVRTPLATMLNIVESFRDCGTALTTQQLEHIDLLDASGQLLMNVIGDLLDSASVESGKMRYVEERVDPKALVDKCFATFDTAYDLADIDFQQEVIGTPPAKMLVDQRRLKQIIFNLLGNAFKHTQKGSIILRTIYSAHDLNISVEDTGCGIEPRKYDQIFERFGQSQTAQSKARYGAGLGLHIVKTMVNEMGGEITFTSQLHKGSCFRVQLPLKRAASTPSAAGLPPSHMPPSGSVLVVEDNVVNQKLLLAFLKKIHCSSVVQNDGQHALEWLLTQPQSDLPKLALIDVNMPRLNGIELCEFIRTQLPGGKDMPLYLVTADVLADHEDAMKRLSINGSISKPINFTTLREVIASHLPVRDVAPAA